MQFTNEAQRELGILRWLHRRTPPPRQVVRRYTLVSRRYGALPVAIEVGPDPARTRYTNPRGVKRWHAELSMPSCYIIFECFGLHGETPDEAADEALQRLTELLVAVVGA